MKDIRPPGRQNGSYFFYLLRIWREQPDGDWRFMLREGTDGERTYFTSLSSLFHYLYNILQGKGKNKNPWPEEPVEPNDFK